MPACALTISPNAQKPTPSPYGRHRPCRQRIRSGSSSMNVENSRSSRVFPTPGFADHAHQLRGSDAGELLAVFLHLAEHHSKGRRLFGPADERGALLLARIHAGQAARTQRTPDRERVRFALHGDRRQVLVFEDRRCGVMRRFADDDRAGGCDVLQPRRGVHHVARHALADLRSLAERDHGFAGVDADADGELQAGLLAVRLLDVVEDLQAGADRALRVVLVPHRGAEHAEHGIADELVHDPAEVLDRAFQQRVVHAEHRLDVLGVGLVRALREPDQVAEQDRDDLAFLAGGHAFERRPAVQTEAGPLRILRAASGADDHGAESSEGPSLLGMCLGTRRPSETTLAVAPSPVGRRTPWTPIWYSKVEA